MQGRGNEAVTELEYLASELRDRQRYEKAGTLISAESLNQFWGPRRRQHAFQVVGHRCEADFDLCTVQPTQEKSWMSEDPVLHSCKWMFDG